MRQAKVLQFKAKSHTVSQIAADLFEVVSGVSGNTYEVSLTPNGPRCTCDWQVKRKSATVCGCSHVVSVMNHLTQEEGRTVAAWAGRDEAKRQHRKMVELGDGLTLTLRKAA